jgi:hydrogenase/urease accessory protein HupE
MSRPHLGHAAALALAFVAELGLAGLARAHEVRPGYLEIRETDASSYRVLWKQPAVGEMRLSIDPVFPDNCSPADSGSQELTGAALLLRTKLRCEGGLAGRTVSVSGLDATLTDVVVTVHYRSGASETHLLRPASPSVVLEGASSTGARALAFLRIGIEHILMGVDHLLFVLGLLLIVKNRMMLLQTITSFTVAHSITLALATLGYASAPVPPLNAAIALSILFLGPEIVRSWRGETSFTLRHPWVVAFCFGLLHGFGFASGLTTMGLPADEIPLALLLFNVGVELGQLFFVLVIVLLERSFRTLEIRWPRWVESLPGYTVGALGAFWTVQRTAMLMGWRP